MRQLFLMRVSPKAKKALVQGHKIFPRGEMYKPDSGSSLPSASTNKPEQVSMINFLSVGDCHNLNPYLRAEWQVHDGALRFVRICVHNLFILAIVWLLIVKSEVSL